MANRRKRNGDGERGGDEGLGGWLRPGLECGRSLAAVGFYSVIAEIPVGRTGVYAGGIGAAEGAAVAGIPTAGDGFGIIRAK